MNSTFGNHLSLLQPLISLDFSRLEPRQEELSYAMPFLTQVVCCRTAQLPLSAIRKKQTKQLSLKMSQAHFRHAAVSATCASAGSRNATVPAVRRRNSIQKRVHDAQAMKTCFEKRTGYFSIIYSLHYSETIFQSTQVSHDTPQWLSRICSSVNVRIYNINKSNKYFCTGFES